MPENSNIFRVSDIIDFANGKWDLSALGDSLDQNTRDAILGIPLSKQWPTDNLYWLYTKNGRYLVRSGYWFGVMNTNLGVSNLSQHPDAIVWKKDMEY